MIDKNLVEAFWSVLGPWHETTTSHILMRRLFELGLFPSIVVTGERVQPVRVRHCKAARVYAYETAST